MQKIQEIVRANVILRIKYKNEFLNTQIDHIKYISII